MTRIIGYAYEAALHCPDCAAAYYADKCDINAAYGSEHDTHGIPLQDDKGNPVNPVFSTDEPGDSGDYCDDCKTNLRSA